MTAARENLIDQLLAAVPGAIRVPDEDWDVEKGRCAVTIDDGVDDTDEKFVLHMLRAFESGGWEILGHFECGAADEVLELAKEWLR